MRVERRSRLATPSVYNSRSCLALSGPNIPERNEANPNKPDLSRTHLNLTNPDMTHLEPYLTIGEKDLQSLYSAVSHTATCHNAPQLTKSDPAPTYATATNQIRPCTNIRHRTKHRRTPPRSHLTIGEKDLQSLYSVVSHTATCHNAPQLTKSDPAPPYATAPNNGVHHLDPI